MERGVVYEVNLAIQADIVEEYMAWLRTHVDAMLGFEGFKSASIMTRRNDEEGDESDAKLVTVQYQVESREALQHYFDVHAAEMRADGVSRFGDKFKAQRRILYLE